MSMSIFTAHAPPTSSACTTPTHEGHQCPSVLLTHTALVSKLSTTHKSIALRAGGGPSGRRIQPGIASPKPGPVHTDLCVSCRGCARRFSSWSSTACRHCSATSICIGGMSHTTQNASGKPCFMTRQTIRSGLCLLVAPCTGAPSQDTSYSNNQHAQAGGLPTISACGKKLLSASGIALACRGGGKSNLEASDTHATRRPGLLALELVVRCSRRRVMRGTQKKGRKTKTTRTAPQQ